MRAWMVVVVATTAACAARKSAQMGYYPEESYGAVSGYGGAAAAPMAPMAPPPMSMPSADYEDASLSDKPSRRDRSQGGAPPPPPPPPPPNGVPAPDPAPADPVEQAEPAEQRMVHYDGWVRLRVANPRDTLEAVVVAVEKIGGRTERMAGTVITVRVPVAKFDEAWTTLTALGDVLDKSVRADDVTEQFTAMDLRARTLRETRNRLVELLARSKDEAEKLMLLQELTRVSEELDGLESQLRTLADLADYSSITVEAVPREAFTASGGRPSLAGFEWIAGLSPFNHSVWADPHRVELGAAEGLVTLTPRGPFVAESADGVVSWAYRVPNDPVGAAAYWASAVEDRLAEEFANPQRTRVADWECLAVDQPAADAPYHWQVCVRSVGRHVEVAQAYYPSPDQLKRYGSAVDGSLAGGGT